MRVYLSVLAYSGVGAVIASRRPHNAIGWIFCAMGLTWELNGLAQAYASYLFLTAPASLNLNDLILILTLSMWVVPFGLTPLLLLLFPNGHILSRRWRLPIRCCVPTVAATTRGRGSRVPASRVRTVS